MKKYQWLLLIGIFLLAFFLRFYNLEQIPPGIHGDEAEFGLIEEKINHGLYDKFFSVGDTNSIFAFPVLSFWTQGLFVRIFGENIFGIRSSSALTGTLAVIIFFFLAKLLFKDKFIPYILTFAFATSHWHIAYSRMAINDIWCTFFVVLVFYFFYKGLCIKKKYNFFLSGIFMGLSLYFPQSSKVIPIIVLICSVFYLKKHSKSFTQNAMNILLLFATAGIVFLPQSVYFLQNLSILTGRIDTVSIFNHLPEYYMRYHVSNIFGVLFWQFINTIKVFNFGGDIGFYFYGYQGPLLAPVASILAIIGFFICFKKFKNAREILLLIWFFSVVFFGGVITIDAPSSQRIVGIIPVAFLFVGIALEKIMSLKIPYIKIVVITIFLLNSFWDYKIYFIDYIHSQAGWAQKEPATQIAYYLKSLGMSWRVYMLRENTWLYFHHGTIRFLNPGLEGLDIDNSENVFRGTETTSKNVVYVMPPNSPSLPKLQTKYPNGKVIYFFNSIDNTTSFTSYEIKK